MQQPSAPVVAFLSQKGGAGKSTLALHVAMAWAREGRRVLLVDADPQGTAMSWARARARLGVDAERGSPAVTVIGLARPTIHQELPALAAAADAVAIDTPGREDAIGRSALMACSLALVPVQPSPADVWALADLMGRIAQARAHGWAGTAATVVSRAKRSRLAEEIRAELRRAGAAAGAEPLATAIGDRVAFSAALGQGRTAIETEPRSPAAAEAAALAEEIAKLLLKEPATRP